MNRIQMYSSSADLRNGLHRVLAVAHSFTTPVVDKTHSEWWSILGEADRDAGRLHRLSLVRLADVFNRPEVQGMVDHARTKLGVGSLDHAAVQAAFKAAIISGRAHKAHGGRDVYGASNKGLWDLVCADFGKAVAMRFGASLGDEAVGPQEREPSSSSLEKLRAFSAFDTSPEGADHQPCIEWLSSELHGLGFAVEVIRGEGSPPLLSARRPARGLAGHVVLYGHYDVTPFGREEKWNHPPRELTINGGRLHARGVADNTGPLACRLAALGDLDLSPELTWLIQGEEETGSRLAHAALPGLMQGLAPTLWVDETGYHDHADGTLRLLGRTVGPSDWSRPPDDRLVELLQALRAQASRWGIGARAEYRGLNKNVVEGGCPFNRNLPPGARYLAIGVNDSRARIHGVNESLPAWTFPLHAEQLDVIFRWAGRAEERQ